MKIGVNDGSISFEGGAINGKHNRAQFLDSPIGRASREDLVNENWRHYHIEPEDGIAGTVLFLGEKLDRVFLMMKIPSDMTDQWTAEIELERKAKHDAWLLAAFGKPPYQFAWGKVISEFDAKGCASDIIVSYAT